MTVSRRTFLTGSLAGAAGLSAQEPSRSRRVVRGQGSELFYLSIAEAAEQIRTRRLSPVDLMAAVQGRISAVDPKLSAFITVVRDEALQAAREAEREIAAGRYRGPLHGIPFGVKDTHYSKGVRTTANSPQLENFIPDFDATVVARLKGAGAILVGKTMLPEFSMGGDTPSKNPWDLTRTPGGSSGGSAVALAAGMLPAATGGDTSNSIRHPATLCNVVGMKATFGLVSRFGIVPISWSLDHIGPMTRTVRDNALMLNVLAGHDPKDDYTVEVPVPDYTQALKADVKGVRVAIPEEDLLSDFHPDCLKAFREAIRIYERMGARILEVKMPSTLTAMDAGQRVIRICEAASYHEAYLMEQADRYGTDPGRPRMEAEVGHLIPAVHYINAQRLRKRFMKEMHQMFSELDVFVTPGRPAPAGERWRVRQDFAKMFNCSGFPALALPAGFSTDPPGLPVGLQIAAAPFQEELIYRVSYAYEQETRWHERRPSL